MATEPVPAPTSQQRASAVSRSLERATARTSLLVMGTTAPSPPRWKVSSGRPWVTTGAFADGFSMSTALRGWKDFSASAPAAPEVTASSG